MKKSKVAQGELWTRNFQLGIKSSDGAVEARLQVALALGADHLLGNLTVLDDEQCRNRAHTELRGEALMFINVHFADLDLALVFTGEFVENGRDHLARTAPFGPEIHEHRGAGLQSFGIKVVLRERCDQRRGHIQIS